MQRSPFFLFSLLLKKGILFLICVYQRCISPFFPPACRFTPSCSSYATYAMEEYGACKGLWLSLKRLGACHPYSQWTPCAHDDANIRARYERDALLND